MTIDVRRAFPEDLSFVCQDGYLPQDRVARKIADGEVYLARRDGQPVAYLRLEYLWSTEPYIALIRVLEAHRRQGVGRHLLGFVEEELLSAGRSVLLSSSQVDEPEPQAWHRHMGFVECGILAGLNEGGVGEVFFRKELR